MMEAQVPIDEVARNFDVATLQRYAICGAMYQTCEVAEETIASIHKKNYFFLTCSKQAGSKMPTILLPKFKWQHSSIQMKKENIVESEYFVRVQCWNNIEKRVLRISILSLTLFGRDGQKPD